MKKIRTLIIFLAVFFLMVTLGYADPYCFLNETDFEVYTWKMPNKGKWNFSSGLIESGKESCFVADDMSLVKFEVTDLKSEPSRRWISVLSLNPGFYLITIKKGRLIIKLK